MMISIDFDDTFTADKETWTKCIQLLQEAGHTVVCISACRNTFENRHDRESQLPAGVPVYCSYDQPKEQYAIEKGLGVNIWIDDCPEAIVGHKMMEHAIEALQLVEKQRDRARDELSELTAEMELLRHVQASSAELLKAVSDQRDSFRQKAELYCDIATRLRAELLAAKGCVADGA